MTILRPQCSLLFHTENCQPFVCVFVCFSLFVGDKILTLTWRLLWDKTNYPTVPQADFTKYIPPDFFTSVSCDQHWVWLASQYFTLKKTNFVQLGCLCVCQEGSSPVASLLPYSRSIALPEKVQASLSTPLFASIVLASRFKEAGLSSLHPAASRC